MERNKRFVYKLPMRIMSVEFVLGSPELVGTLPVEILLQIPPQHSSNLSRVNSNRMIGRNESIRSVISACHHVSTDPLFILLHSSYMYVYVFLDSVVRHFD